LWVNVERWLVGRAHEPGLVMTTFCGGRYAAAAGGEAGFGVCGLVGHTVGF